MKDPLKELLLKDPLFRSSLKGPEGDLEDSEGVPEGLDVSWILPFFAILAPLM